MEMMAINVANHSSHADDALKIILHVHEMCTSYNQKHLKHRFRIIEVTGESPFVTASQCKNILSGQIGRIEDRLREISVDSAEFKRLARRHDRLESARSYFEKLPSSRSLFTIK